MNDVNETEQESPGLEASDHERLVMMPRRLTAENGAKALLMGEFYIKLIDNCFACDGTGFDGECVNCDGSGSTMVFTGAVFASRVTAC